MLSSQEEEAERIATLRNDQRVREQAQQGTTFHQHAQAQALDTAGGRFAATGAPRVVGSTPNPSAQYPAASSAHQTELPPEEPLGFSIDEMPNPTGVSPVTSPVAPGGAAAPSCPSGVEPAPPSSSEQDESNG
jgi:hypothetical protein